MAPPERITESQMEEILKLLGSAHLIEDDVPYSRADLLNVFKSSSIQPEAEPVFWKFRTLAQDQGRIGSIDVLVNGTKRGRSYTFSGLGALAAVRETVGPAATAVRESAPPTGTLSTNDHPEDRIHVEAHIALLLARRCVGLSLPKVSGARSRGNAVDANPDFVGVRAERSVAPLAVELPEWIDSRQAPARHALIGAEFKASLNSAGELSRAIRQTLHNTRFFHEGWLVAPIPQPLYAEATLLGEEYNVGVISVFREPTTRHEILWTPRPRSSRLTFKDFAYRYESEELAEFCEKLEQCRRVAERLSDRVREDLIGQLVSDQRAESMVLRLPSTMVRSLAASTHDAIERQDVEAYATVLRSALLDAYEYDAPEEQTPGDYVSETLAPFLSSTAVPLSRASRDIVRAQLTSFLRERRAEFDDFLSAIGDR